jgi:hypothetical protein
MRLPITSGGTPPCFGREWDPNEPACAGGLDPVARDPRTGSHKLDHCPFFTSCGARTQALREPQPPAVSAFYQQLGRAAAAAPLAIAPAPAAAPRPQGLPLSAPSAIVHPASTYQLNYVVPGYLSVPEPRADGESIWRLLGRLVLRAVLKALGQELAHFADTHPLKKEDRR